jgi:hypothetical protein
MLRHWSGEVRWYVWRLICRAAEIRKPCMPRDSACWFSASTSKCKYVRWMRRERETALVTCVTGRDAHLHAAMYAAAHTAHSAVRPAPTPHF